MARYIDSKAESGDVIICNPPSTFPDIFSYYWRRTDLPDKQVKVRSVDCNPGNIERILSGIKNFKRVWVLLSYRGLDDKELIREAFAESYDLAGSQEYSEMSKFGLQAYLFVKKLNPD